MLCLIAIARAIKAIGIIHPVYGVFRLQLHRALVVQIAFLAIKPAHRFGILEMRPGIIGRFSNPIFEQGFGFLKSPPTAQHHNAGFDQAVIVR